MASSKVGPRQKLAIALAAAGLVMAAVAVAGPASGIATPPPAGLSGYATGSAVHTDALQLAAEGPRLADVNQAFSAASVNSRGLSTPLASETNGTVIPAQGALEDGLLPAQMEAYGRGAGAEIGVGTPVPDVENARLLALAGLAGAASQPPDTSSDPITPPVAPATQTGLVQEEVAIPGNPVVFAGLLRGRALAMWNEQYAMPMLGNPLSLGNGFAADVQLLNAGDTERPDGSFANGIINTDAPGPERATSQTTSFTYLVNNGDGTCGLAAEVRQTIAPVRLNLPPDDIPANDVVIEAAGEWVMRGMVTGKPGSTAQLTYPIGNVDITMPVLRIINGEEVSDIITLEDFFEEEGLILDPALEPLLDAAVAEPPRAIAAPGATPVDGSQPTRTATSLSVAADAVRVSLLSTAAGTPEPGPRAFDLRVGHFEMKLEVPPGGINCEIPIDKSGPQALTAPATGEHVITVPLNAEVLKPFPCELTNITVTDRIEVERVDDASRPPRMNITGGTGPGGVTGVVSGDRQSITFTTNLTYKPGDPPLVFRVRFDVPANSGPGTLRNIATATATPANCTIPDELVGSLIGGDAFFGRGGAGLEAAIEGAGTSNITGRDILGPIGILGVLAVTGPSSGTFFGIGLAALLSAAAVWRVRRRVST